MQRFAKTMSNTLETSGDFYPEDVVAGFVRESIAKYCVSMSSEVVKYIRGHEKRFIKTLARIPKARVPNEKCLDIGGFALTPFWLSQYFGYSVVVYNWDPNEAPCSRRRVISLDGAEVGYDSVNVDLDGPWPESDSSFSFILFGETLEHLSDPLVAMKRLNRACRMGGSVLLTTPNANSLTVLTEYLKGLPPWVFRYFEPDAGGTRHIFEQTPASMCQLSEASGFHVVNMSTDYCYTDFSASYSLLSKVLYLDPTKHGDVMFLTLSKAGEGTGTRPSLLYDVDRFYREDQAEYAHILTEKINQIRIDMTAKARWDETIREETGAQTAKLDALLMSERESADSATCSLDEQLDNVAYLLDSISEMDKSCREEQKPAHLLRNGESESLGVVYLLDEMDRIPLHGVVTCEFDECASVVGGYSETDDLAYLLDALPVREELPVNEFTPDFFSSDGFREDGKKGEGYISEMIYQLDLLDRGFHCRNTFPDGWSNKSFVLDTSHSTKEFSNLLMTLENMLALGEGKHGAVLGTYPIADESIAYCLDRFDNCAEKNSWLACEVIGAKNYCKEYIKKYPSIYRYCRWMSTGLHNPVLLRKKLLEKTKEVIRRWPKLYRLCKKIRQGI